MLSVHALCPAHGKLPRGGRQGTLTGARLRLVVAAVVQDVRVTGVDVNSAMVPFAVKAASDMGLPEERLRLVTGNVQALPFPDDCFDVVVCTLVRMMSN